MLASRQRNNNYHETIYHHSSPPRWCGTARRIARSGRFNRLRQTPASTAAIVAGAAAIVGALIIDSNNHPYYVNGGKRYYVTQAEANTWKQRHKVVQRQAYVPEREYPVPRDPYHGNQHR